MKETKEVKNMLPMQNNPTVIYVERKINYSRKGLIEDLAVIRSVLVTGIVALHFLKALDKFKKRKEKKTLIFNMEFPKSEKKEDEVKGE